MKIKPYVEKLNTSPEYKKFVEKYKDAYLAAGFFIIDFEQGNNIHQIDYYIPSEKKIGAFTLDKDVVLQMMEVLNEAKPEKLDIKTKIDLEALKGIVQDEMRNRGITEEIKKMIAIIQNIKGKKTWTVSCILSGMEILKANIEDKSETVLRMERTSITDIIRKVPMSALQPSQKSVGESDDTESEIEKLDKLEMEIEKEKSQLKKDIASNPKNQINVQAKTAKGFGSLKKK